MFANDRGTPPIRCGSGGSCSVCAPCLIIHLCRLSVKVAFIEAPRPRLSGRPACALCGPWAPGRGLGCAFIAEAMEKHAELRLWVFQRNSAAIRFYGARGFIRRPGEVLLTQATPPMMAPQHLETNVMVGALHQNAPILSVASFRAWLASRPDEVHWELIEGVPMMMIPPNRRHQRIASNLESLLNAALKRHDPMFVAYHDIGVNIVSTVPYDAEPRYADRFYLVAEVLSESDKGIIEGKRDIYRGHASCTCILLVRQDRLE